LQCNDFRGSSELIVIIEVALTTQKFTRPTAGMAAGDISELDVGHYGNQFV
jgi:hypothetical protein